MNETIFRNILIGVAVAFTGVFCVLVVPALIADGDIVRGFAAEFVNPYASGYSIDVIFCWVVLAVWVFYDARVYSVRQGWICLMLGVIPGVAVGLALYLVLRQRQIVDVVKN